MPVIEVAWGGRESEDSFREYIDTGDKNYVFYMPEMTGFCKWIILLNHGALIKYFLRIDT